MGLAHPGRPVEAARGLQAVYDERELEALPDGRTCAAFFFHFLDTSRPMEIAGDTLPVPDATPIPPELENIEYEMP